MHVKKGEQVRVIAGNDKGKTGEVVSVLRDRNRVIVQGVNMRIKHTKPTQQNPQGAREEREQSIHASNVMPLDESGKTRRS